MPKEEGGTGAVARSEEDGHLSVSEGRSGHELHPGKIVLNL